MVHQKGSLGRRGSGLQQGRRNAVAGHLPQIVLGTRVAVGVDESGEEDVAIAVDMLGSSGVGADGCSVNNDRAGRKDAMAVEDADIVQCNLGVGCTSIIWSSVVRYNHFCWIQMDMIGIATVVVKARSNHLKKRQNQEPCPKRTRGALHGPRNFNL